jgi:hypothetical protein
LNKCRYCGKETKGKEFCSRICKENNFQLLNISVPKLFINRINKLSKEEYELELLNFAKRFNFKIELVKKRIEINEIKEKTNLTVNALRNKF